MSLRIHDLKHTGDKLRLLILKSTPSLMEFTLGPNDLNEFEDRYSEILSEELSGPASIKDIAEWNESVRIDRDSLGSVVKSISMGSSSGIPTVTIMSDDSPSTCCSKDCTEKSGQAFF